MGTVALDAISSGRNSTGNITVSHTTGSGANRILIAVSTVQDGNKANYPVTGITYNDVSLTKVRHDEPAGNVRTEIWYLLNPPTGTYDCIKTTTGNLGESTLGVVTLTGVSQTAPEADNGATGTNSTPSVSLTTVANNAWSITVACAEANFTAINNSQTALTGYPLTDQGFENAHAGRLAVATAGATTLSYTISSGQPWAISAVSLAPEGGPLPDKTTHTVDLFTKEVLTETHTTDVLVRLNAPPTVVLNTPPNEEVVTTATPTLYFTGTDPDGDDICYEIEISETPFA